MAPLRGPVLVVVSYYDARPVAELDALLRSLATVPAGFPFDVRVVVNQQGAEPTALAARHPGVQVLHRPNAGWNIGAWEHGWRAEPAYEAYLFLQHECTLRRDGWLLPFVERLNEPGMGLVGERLNPAWAAGWAEIERKFAGHELPDHVIDGRPAPRLEVYRDFFARHGIDPGARADHLQTLVLAARRQTLVAIDGFPVGGSYGEAIAAEIAISKKVQALGLAIGEVGAEPFTCISHPQWLGRAPATAPAARRPRVGLTQWLQDLRRRGRFADKPWLVLGKGPTFARLDDGHRAAHHLFGLNHVVRATPVAIAHVIDIDVIAACAASLPANCEYLLMPRLPHVDSAPGRRLLEQYFAELPVLDELDRQGRLVWYNCSTGNRTYPGSPVIDVNYFSSEAAFGILGRLGARKVRTLGIDGGRQYSRSFADLADTTRLGNGQPLFDLQFERIRRIVAEYGIDWAPLVPPIQVRIDGGEELALPAKVLEYSIRKHASFPVAVAPVVASQPAPAGAIRLQATSIAGGDIAELARPAAAATPTWLMDFAAQRPWLLPFDPTSERWLDMFAEAVNAGVVPPALVRRAIARGHAHRALRRLPMSACAPTASEVECLEHRLRCLQRELANSRQSLTFRLGRLFLAPAVAIRQLLRRLTK